MESTEASLAKHRDFQHVAGVDEAGRGPLAGPVTAACVVLPKEYLNAQIADSKKLSEKKRELLFESIVENSLAYSVVSVGPRRIEQLNIRQATRLAMNLAAERVAKKLNTEDVFYLIDGNMEISNKLSQETIVKGDSKVFLIAAASILAKVHRDRLMGSLDNFYPDYGLAKHKGYPTKSHQQLIVENGPCNVHRRTFAGVKEYI